MGFWPVVKNVLKNSDVVLLLVDTRMPEITRNQEIISQVGKIGGKRLVIVFNKIDLARNSDIEKLKKEYPSAYFTSGRKKMGVPALKAHLENLADNWNKQSLRVGVVGYPNVGKSTLINLIAPGAKAKVSPVSGTTKKTQWIRTGKLRIMDSPGVIPYSDKSIGVGITASKDPHKIKNPERVALRVIEFLEKKGYNTLEKFYGIEAQEHNAETFEAIGKKKGFLLKGGIVDEHRTAIKILEDWQKGKISLK